MNARHRKQFSNKIVTGSATLYRYLIDKYHQSRKIVRQDLVSCILREGRLLTFNTLELVDGMPARDKALVNLYHIQKRTFRMQGQTEVFAEKDTRELDNKSNQ